MGKNVFANGNEVSAKKSDNKTICAMPDVCLSPPSPPAGPVPVPYPNSSSSSKTSGGSKTVKIGGQEVGLKNKSNYKSSNGDEAATKGLGMGIVSHNIQGPMKHAAWSMDIKIEGKNAIRHLDMTTHNHTNPPQPDINVDQASQTTKTVKPSTCEELDQENQIRRREDMKEQHENTPLTLTTATRTDAQGKVNNKMRAIDSQHKLRRAATGYQKKNDSDEMPCTDESAGGNQRRNHTEPKLIVPEHGGGGSITMKIHHQFWKKNDKGNIVKPKELLSDAMPCDQCKKAICAAGACEPPFKILLCSKDNKPQEPPCNKDHTPQPESAWAAKGLS